MIAFYLEKGSFGPLFSSLVDSRPIVDVMRRHLSMQADAGMQADYTEGIAVLIYKVCIRTK